MILSAVSRLIEVAGAFMSYMTNVASAAAALFVLSFGAAHAADELGHAMAEKFSAASEEKKREDGNSKRQHEAEEAEMLERARKEAEQRRIAAEKALADAEAEEQRKAEAQRLAEEAARKSEAERQARAAEEQRKAEAARRAEKARIAEEQRLAEEARKVEEARRAEAARLAAENARKQEAERQARAVEEARMAEEIRRSEQARLAEEQRTAEAKRLELEAEREARARQIEEKLRAIELARAEKLRTESAAASESEGAAPRGALSSSPPMSLGRSPEIAGDLKQRSGRVAVLLVMDPGTKGIRRFGQKTADPVICAGSECWISTGSDKPSRAVSRGAALGPANTLGRRAAACNKKLACVYRDVDLRAGAILQPVDLRIMRHDRRKPLSVSPDETCTTANGQLFCGTMYRSGTWRAWIVPEEIATAAGSAALEAALDTGLNPAREAALKN